MKWLAVILWPLLEAPAFAAAGTEYHDPLARIFLSLAIILVAAKFCSHFAERIGQPPVLGELAAGVILGNLSLLGFSRLDFLKTDIPIDLLAQIGVVLLLFQVGLESTVGQMLRVGISSFLVASLGITGSFTLGWLAANWLLPAAAGYTHVFVGAAVTATSVGITARVFKDLGRSQSGESRVILGAAVIDDILGLVILAVVTGVISVAYRGGSLSYAAVILILAKATIFLVSSLGLGIYLSPQLFSLASRLQTSGVLLAVGLSFCFLLAWFASYLGLAPILGAFAAGLILEDLHFRDFVYRGEKSLDELVAPIASFLIPVFFVLTGIRTDLGAFARPGALVLAIVLTFAAIVGKQLSCLGVLGHGIDRFTVGIGMIPRGEVELIFANVGLTLMAGGKPVIDRNTFSAIVVMVIATAIVTPPMLKWSIERDRKRQQSSVRSHKSQQTP